MLKDSLILIPMKVMYLFLIVILCSCASPGFKVINPTRIQSHSTYTTPESLTSQVEDDLKKKKWNR